ncbi:nicotinate phosphoribosyltransferase [Microtetraspora sp. NBRC 16547]|uniref:nicotinate phosphoribosyltransferase n=1 Tax=Microtetraspora sp. NBRC 16547 TaxID=3030993 RepID=UPI0024A5C548|nr:nicotinate phosphoribosyltransferase [Microtetraspora sp. NBRC 16547]GLX02356.1 nicotinate phosphoribosyltransferase [Microtetraspora sp. NBRC 16547]
MPGGLLTDMYELNMAASYLRRGMTDQATFSLFVRRLPAERGFLISAGLEDALRFLEDFSFEQEDLDYLREIQGYGAETLRAFADLRFTGEVWAVPEGRAVFAGEPLLEVTAPIAEAQMVETAMLNHLTFQTSVASKAVRCVLAAGGARLIDFAFRRTQGVETGMAVARAMAIAGFAATSNAEAARRHGLPASGTMAHSYVQAFPSEEGAFAAFAADFPDRTIFLVDTYDTLSGVRTAVDVVRRLRLTGPVGVRLDSGDLGALAREARRLLDAAGLRHARIVASGGLDEYEIAGLVEAGAPIDAYGVGTKVGVSADAPYLDTAYKLVAYGDRPVMKLSPGKVTLPGAKQVFRGPDRDMIALREETPPAGWRPLLVPVLVNGHRVAPGEPITVVRDRCMSELARLPAPARALRAPRPVPVEISPRLRRLQDRLRGTLSEHVDGHAGPPLAGSW